MFSYQKRDLEMDRNEQRVPFHSDPIGTSDHLIVYGGLALYGVTALLMLWAWINHKYPPIRARNLELVTIMYLSGLGWFAGSFICNGLVLGDWVFHACRGWAIWLRVFCAYAFSCTVLFRIYALDRIFVQGKIYRGWTLYMPFVGLAISLILFCIVAQVVPDRLTVIYLEFYKTCHYVFAFRYTCIALNWCMWTICFVVAWRCRNIYTCFNEYQESLVVIVLGLLNDLQMTLVHVYLPDYAMHNWQRGLAASCDLLLTLVAIWIALFYASYQCMFHRGEYLQSWLQKMARDGLRREYDIDSDPFLTLRPTEQMCTESDAYQLHLKSPYGRHSDDAQSTASRLSSQKF